MFWQLLFQVLLQLFCTIQPLLAFLFKGVIIHYKQRQALFEEKMDFNYSHKFQAQINWQQIFPYKPQAVCLCVAHKVCLIDKFLVWVDLMNFSSKQLENDSGVIITRFLSILITKIFEQKSHLKPPKVLLKFWTI